MSGYSPRLEEVKRYAAAKGIAPVDALKALRAAHTHTAADATFRLRQCRRNHSAVYQRRCAECGVWYCELCQRLLPRKETV